MTSTPTLFCVFRRENRHKAEIDEEYNKYKGPRMVREYKDIPNIFTFNQIYVLSNGMPAKLGARSSGSGFFFEWPRKATDG